MKIETRIAIEKRIARKIVEAALAAGYTISVFDCEEWTLKKSSDKKAIMQALFTTDDDQLRFRKADGEYVGWCHLVYGNDGYDVLADYTVNMEEFFKPINEYADKLADRHA